MEISVGDIRIENSNSTVFINREYQGYLLSFSFAHYPAYLVELSNQYESRKYRKVIFAPDIIKDYDKYWFEEYLANLVLDGYIIHGVWSLNDIVLPEYKPSEEYVEYAKQQEAMWKALRDEQ